MIIRHVTAEELYQALHEVNKVFDGNICFRKLDQIGHKAYRVALYTHDSHGPGARISFTGRHMRYACWHVHGLFFEHLFLINNNVMIRSNGMKIDSPDDNWQDWNAGNLLNPRMMSELCECRFGNR